ncbi:MAG: TonB family protein [Bacteroidota bacterium]|nr:TonB family protein [Bacteroidota bacterium]
MMTSHYHNTSFGWIGSVILHGVMGIILFFSYFHPTLPQTKYIEISLGTMGGGSGNLPKFSLPTQAEPDITTEEKTSTVNNPVALPGRTYFPLTEDVIHLPTTKKSVNSDPNAPITLSNKITTGRDERRSSSFYSSSPGKKEGPTGSYSGSENGTGVVPGSGGEGKGGYGSGDGIGDNVSFGIRWANGINRRMTVGDIPTYPSGVNTGAQIKLRVVVLPNGTVKTATPLQKGDTRLENAALAKVKFWQFEPLQSAQPQLEQVCNITFNFKLK